MNARAEANPVPKEEMPERDPRRPGLNKESALVADLLKLLPKIRAKEINVASRLLARSDDLEMLAAGVRDELSILDGWRFEQFGRDAVDLVEGRMAFAGWEEHTSELQSPMRIAYCGLCLKKEI